MKKWIAQRNLRYSLKGEDKRSELVVRISEPYLLEEGAVNFDFAEGTAGCTVEVIGLKSGEAFENKNVHEIYGADSMQALELAVNIEPLLKRLNKKYDIYFPTGELYFEGENT
jgi:acyl carrier protein